MSFGIVRFSPCALRRALGRTVAVAGAAALTAGALSVAAAPSGAAPADETVVLSEDFSGGALPTGWRAVDGNWKVQDGRLVGTATGGSNKITFGRHLENFRFEATVRFERVNEPTRWEAFGLDVPASGATPWWIATLRSGSTAPNGLEFAQLTTAGSWNVTNTAAAPHAAGTGRDVRVAIEVHGNRARWFFDGRQMVRTTALTRSADGVQAFVVNGSTVSFDDVKLTSLPPNGYLRPEGAPVGVIAHRGASSAAPENTLVSQEVGRRAGADFIENDVQPSKDGVPFILHDKTVDRTTEGVGNIRDLTAAQLKGLDAGSWFAPHYRGAPIPTLAEQLADLRTRGGNLLLEIKGAHTRDEVARIVEVIRAERMAGRVFVQSFEVDALRHTRDLAPELPLGLLRSTLDADPVAIAKDLHLTAYNPNHTALLARPGVVADLHEAGVAVMAWTVNSASSWKSLEAIGVDSIITDKPAELAGWNDALTYGLNVKPTVRIASPADGSTLDRVQRPVAGVIAAGADGLEVTLDGDPIQPGRPLDLTALPAGEHTLRAEAGGVSTTSTFTITATHAGLGHLLLTSGAEKGALTVLMTKLVQGDYDDIARHAIRWSGRLIPAKAATVIATDAQTLAERRP
ncbi:glycerophosphodiester phosphodiesterase [Thermomonospora umbrina]|uniref:Glycerophosphoryl diester phosphodiesterase n=1 Tax=Thermomonospora umbrina TaxID=111806 RepID=A0A3D9SLA6_9ACTN|nr:glycerophosphodiester phosphodiesterase family protein [Thermomonospora umbrina]REE96716.1 glycerophosphoryl diester phosphodiesterase [Thermomonospora umbrina]